MWGSEREKSLFIFLMVYMNEFHRRFLLNEGENAENERL